MSRHSNDTSSHYLTRARVSAWCVMVFERLWPLILPFLLLVSIFLTLSWFDIFVRLPYWPHVVLLVILGTLAFISLLLPMNLRLPSRVEVDQRIEKESGLSFQPITAQNDVLSQGSGPVAETLWQEHRRRMALMMQNLKCGMPHPDIPRRDPLALRAIVILSLGIAFAFSFGSTSGKLADAFYFDKIVTGGAPVRIDAWVTPPAYTHRPPVYLTTSQQIEKTVSNEAGTGAKIDQLQVPQNSVLTIRVTGAGRKARAFLTTHDGEGGINSTLSPEIKNAESNIPDNTDIFVVPLLKSADLTLKAGSGEKKWIFVVDPDQAPRIEWTAPPERALNGMLTLNYRIKDDFGGVKGWVEMTPVDNDTGKDQPKPHDEGSVATEKAHGLYTAPDIDLAMPRNGTTDGQTQKNLTYHPWAGTEVEMTLFVRDGADNVGKSDAVKVILPQKTFGNSLARAVVEQRRLLALDTGNKNRVLDMLYAIQLRPADTIGNFTTTIALRSAWTRLSFATGDDMLRNVADYMWQIALGIEEGELSTAEQRLKRAQQALREALRNGASPEEIDRLMAELKDAMDSYMRELAERGDRQLPNGQKGKMLSGDDMQKKLKELEDMAKLGNHAAAEQLLSELENLMDNLYFSAGDSKGTSGTGKSKKDDMQKSMDDLADMMRRQQEMLNDTNRLNQEYERGGTPDEDYRQGMKDLEKKQGDLRQELDKLKKNFEAQGLKPGKELGDAGQAMENAQGNLKEGDGDYATENQSDALEAMRAEAQNMMKQMREAMEKAGEGAPKDHNALDPLGRDRNGTKGGEETGTKVPDEMDVQRARRILDEIRKRLGNLTPQTEKQYLERLLKFN